MDWANLLKELGAKTSLLWGVAVGSLCIWVADWVSPLGIPSDWRWVLPVAVIGSWAVVLSGLVPTWTAGLKEWWKACKEQKRKDEYALKNVIVAGSWEKAVLIYWLCLTVMWNCWIESMCRCDGVNNLNALASHQHLLQTEPIYYKEKNQQRFKGANDQAFLSEMVGHGLLENDSLSEWSYVQHYEIRDVVWKFLDNPPQGWDKGKRVEEASWE